MFELQIATDNGWDSLNCSCAAGRALFVREEAAQAALQKHLSGCGADAGGKFRAAAVEPQHG